MAVEVTTGVGSLNELPPVDPSENVKALSEAANKRQDDLRDAERRYNDLRAEHQKEMNSLRDEHAKELSAKESSRLDSIRQVDREEVAKTAASNNLAIGTLAKQTTELATTLQNQAQANAAAAETRRTADMSEVNKRVSALELASSASAGKQQVADPQMAAFMADVKKIIANQATTGGERRGISMSAVILMGAVTLILGLLTIGGFIYALNRPAQAAAQPEIIYVPAPPQTSTITTSAPKR